MPRQDKSNNNPIISFAKRLVNKVRYIFSTKSIFDIYNYIEELIVGYDEEGLTILRNPAAVDSGSSLNHYDHDGINHFYATHPALMIAFLAGAAVIGVARLIQLIASTPDYPKTISEFMALIQSDSNPDIELQPLQTNLDKDLKQLNSLCSTEELGIPYYFTIEDVPIRKKRAKSGTTEQQSLLNTTATKKALILYKKALPEQQKAIEDKLNWFERTYTSIANSKFANFVLTPPWKATMKGAYAYWALYFSAYIITLIVTGTAALTVTVTGTVAVTTAALATIIGIPMVIGLSYFGINLINIFQSKDKSTKPPNGAPQKVANQAEREGVFKLLGQALALRWHTTKQQQKLGTFKEKIQLDDTQPGKEKIDEVTTQPAINQVIDVKNPGHVQFSENGVTDTEASLQPQNNNKKFSPSKKLISWQTFTDFCNGYVQSSFAVWFLTSAITSFAVKFGLFAISAALASTVVGIPISLLITFSVSMAIGGIFAARGGVNSSIAQKEKEAILAAHPELQPEAIKAQEKNMKNLKCELKRQEEQRNKLVQQYNQLKGLDPTAGTIPLTKLDYRDLKNTNVAYCNPNQSKLSKALDYIIVGIGNAGRMGYITRSLMIAGMITLLAVAFAHPLGFLTGPLAIGVAVGVSAVLFGAATVADRHYQKQREQEELNNLRLRRFEIKEKRTLENNLRARCNEVEDRNKELTTEIEAMKKDLKPVAEETVNLWISKKDRSNSLLDILHQFFLGRSSTNKSSSTESCNAAARLIDNNTSDLSTNPFSSAQTSMPVVVQ